MCSSTGKRVGFITYGTLENSGLDLYLLYESVFKQSIGAHCNGVPDLEGSSYYLADDYFNDTTILSAPLQFSEFDRPLNGTLSGPYCALNGYSWINVCFNNDSSKTSFDVPYFTYNSKGQAVHETHTVTIEVPYLTVVPIPDLYPYVVVGTCPPGLKTIPLESRV